MADAPKRQASSNSTPPPSTQTHVSWARPTRPVGRGHSSLMRGRSPTAPSLRTRCVLEGRQLTSDQFGRRGFGLEVELGQAALEEPPSSPSGVAATEARPGAQ